MKRLMWVLSFLLLAVTFQMSASAATKKPIVLSNGYLWEKENSDSSSLGWEENVSINYSKLKITSISSSKPKVVKIVKDSDGYSFQSIKPLKVGKSKITLKYKYKGKNYTTSAVYTVKKYPNAVKSVYINGKKVTLKKKSYIYKLTNYKNSKAKIKLVPAKGWTVVSAYKNDANDSVRFKNGNSVKLEKDSYCDICYELKNKSGLYAPYTVHIETAE